MRRLCKHNRRPNRCKNCKGTAICEHGKRKEVCIKCDGSGVCSHKRLKYGCKECGGTGICKHQRQKSTCKECKPTGAFRQFIRWSIKRGISVDLTLDEYLRLIRQPCHYCGSEKISGIDRVNSNAGYTIVNCVSACTMCNKMKLDYTQEEFIEHVLRISKFMCPIGGTGDTDGLEPSAQAA